MREPGKFLEDGFDLNKIEAKILSFWEENRVFEESLEKTKNGSPYTFYDGPPFATGLPHYGHILASTIKDLIPRYQTMRGRFVRRRWGWDCHGLPIEEIVERKLGISGKKEIEKIGIHRFNEVCRSTVLQFAKEWGAMVRRLARWVEFDNSYKTMDRSFIESVWWGFKQIYDKGLVYEGRKVLLYCPRCETPISNFEVAMDNSYKDVTEEAVTVRFKVRSGSNASAGEDTYLLAWTTTPWTLPGNVALAVGAEIEYVKVSSGGTFYILAKDIFESLPGRDPKDPLKLAFDLVYADEKSEGAVSAKAADVVQTMKGSELVGLEYEPLFDVPLIQSAKSYKVYAADFVTTAEGAGIVHTAVVYGEDDYTLGLREGLPVVPLLDEKGMFNEKAPALVRGTYFEKANALVADDLSIRGLLFARAEYAHSYPHCWRCSTKLFYNAIPAWFINIQKIKPELIRSNADEVAWFPAHLKHGRYEKSVEQAPDWNISRNRYWGNPIPIWKCASCAEIKVAGSIADLGLPTTTFHFARHGEAANNVADIVSSYPEKAVYDLTDAGVARAEAMAEKLRAAGGVDVIVSSDLLRTRHTAEIVGQALGVPVTFDGRLRELDFGAWNGKKGSEFDSAFPRESRWTTAAAGGENWTDVRIRLLACLDELARAHPGKRILIVSHGDVLWVAMQYFGIGGEYPTYATPCTAQTELVDLHRPYIDNVVLPCAKCGGESRRITEIFDSWVEAGSMPFAEYHYPFENKDVFLDRYPAQFVTEYIAQTRAWFYTMHVLCLILFGRAPFQNVLTTGTILAEDGAKLSKSKRNFPDPWLTIEKYGVDALRFFLMNSPVMQADNVNFSERELGSVYRRVILLWWNVYNYYATYAAEAGFVPDRAGLTAPPAHALDRWIWLETDRLVGEVTAAFDAYDTIRATRAMQAYIDDLSTWYVRRGRGRKDAEFFGTLRHALLVSAKVMAPVMPYMSELVYTNLNLRPEAPSVHLAAWPEARELQKDEHLALQAMEVIREAASLGLALRKQLNIPVRQPFARLALEVKAPGLELAPELIDILLSELNVKRVDPALKSEKNEAIKIAEGSKLVGSFYLDSALSEELKLEGLVRKLEREIQELRKENGLEVGMMVSVAYGTPHTALGQAMPAIDKSKTYIQSLSEAGYESMAGAKEVEIDGQKIKISLRRLEA